MVRGSHDSNGGRSLKEIVNIRPHHLLCIINFDGLGYSTEFVEKLRVVKEKIDEDSIVIRLTEGQDDICKTCPNRMKCSQMNYTRILDKKVMIATDLEYGKEYGAAKLIDIIKSKITWNLLNMICENCAFYYKCKKIFLNKMPISNGNCC
ncbi:MAG TPA: DUF1284 domain-containing protein [Candidatus Methanofastidiosa archaeon]|nr:DUF1284 domain-containing protein [Candidatus Methanofastidiosa archaeon]HPR40946.1 DUF1284 domain-containing protein [Candidatus Methanofastidiosa archaeon]